MLKKIIAVIIALIVIDVAYLVISKLFITAPEDHVSQTPDFSVLNVGMSADTPDLFVTVGNSGASAPEGAQLHVIVDGNTLSRDEAGHQITEPFDGHIYEGDVAPPQKGESGTFTLPIPSFVLETGLHEVTVTINGNKSIAETDSSNNTVTLVPTVPVAPHEGE